MASGRTTSTARRRPPTVAIASSQSALRVPRKALAELVAFVARAEGVRLGHVDLAVVANDEMARLNRRHIGHIGPTDVLSFDLSDDGDEAVTAQVIVCGEVAVKAGPAHGNRPQHELMLYVIHGLLHLSGYDDKAARARATMYVRQEELLGGFLAGRRRRRRAARR